MSEDLAVFRVAELARGNGQTIPPLAGLDGETLSALSRRGRLQELAPGQRPAERGTGAHPSLILLSGILRHKREGSDGQRQILNLILRGDVVRAERVERRGHEVEAATRAVVLAVHRDEFDRVLQDRPALERAERRSAHAYLERMRWLTLSILALDAEERLCAFLDCFSPLMNVSLLPRGTHFLTIPLPWSDIADLLAMSVAQVDRALVALEEAGLIRVLSSDRVEVFDARGLRDRGTLEKSFADCPSAPVNGTVLDFP